jgi:hypothetical protein
MKKHKKLTYEQKYKAWKNKHKKKPKTPEQIEKRRKFKSKVKYHAKEWLWS